MSVAPAWLGGGAALAASVSWAISTTIFKGAILRHGVRAMNLFRLSVALVLFWATTLAVDGGRACEAMATREGAWLLASGAVGLALGDYFLFAALQRLGAQPAIAMNQISPVWSALLGWIAGSEALAPRELLGIALVIAGVLLVIFGRAPERAAVADAAGAAGAAARVRSLGIAFGLLSSLCNALAGMMTHHAIDAVGALPGSTLRMSGGAAALVLFAFASRGARADFAPLRGLPRMGRELFAVFLATFVGIFLQQKAFAELDASIALCLLSTTPLFLLPLAVGILRERYLPRAWLGTVIATAGVPLLLVPAG